MVRHRAFGVTSTFDQNWIRRRNYSNNLGRYSRREIAELAKYKLVAVLPENTP